MRIYDITDRGKVFTVGMADILVWRCTESGYVLIDTGTVESNEFLNLLDEMRIHILGIIHTHLHVDHIANDNLLYQKYHCPIYATGKELEETTRRGTIFDYPIIENEEDGIISISGVEFRTIFLPGHSRGHQAIITPDGICAAGDAFMSQNRLERAKIPYMRYIDRSILSLEQLRDTSYPYYLAAHKGLVLPSELSSTIDANIEIELKLYELMKSLVTYPVSREELRIRFMKAAGVTSERVMAFRFMHETADARIDELILAGEFSESKGMIYPANLKEIR